MLGVDPRSVAGAILHDALEEGGLSPDCISDEFGFCVAKLGSAPSWPQRTSRYPNGTHVQRRLLSQSPCAATNDPDLLRSLYLLLAEKLHHLRFSGRQLPLAQRRDMARLAMGRYSPVVRILARPGLDSEVQEAVSECRVPVWYRRIAQQMKILVPERRAFLGEVVRVLRDALPQMGIEAQIEWRVKQITSAYDKMLRTGRPLSDICDLVAVRVIVEQVPDCFHVQSLVESLGQSISEEYDDYITRPKRNNYQSLHMVILAPTGARIEVQIRTREMHRTAEHGRAAHCLYTQKRRRIEFLTPCPVLAENSHPLRSLGI
jgi:GTP pyrophosphokinase